MRVFKVLIPLLLPLGAIPYSFTADAPKETSKIFSPTVSGTPAYDNNKNIVLGFYKAMQDNNPDKLNSFLALDYQIINAGEVQESPYSKFTEMSKNLTIRTTALHKALPNFKLDVSEILVDGNKVLARVTISGIQKGVFLGIIPMQQPIHIKFFDLITLKDEKIVHIAEMWNELSIMKQLGYIVL
jgi:predicted ester cyclase